MVAITWYVTDHAQPRAAAAEPGVIGIDVPDDVLDWATGHGLSLDDPDVYMLVGDADGAGLEGWYEYLDGQASETDAAAIAAAISDLERERDERDA